MAQRHYLMLLGLVGILATFAVACSEPVPNLPSTTAPEAAGSSEQTAASTPPSPTQLTQTPIPAPAQEPPSASFSVDMESGSAPLEVDFNNTSQGPMTSVEWGFGDGTISTEQSPTHRYTIAGIYTVKLTVSGPGGTNSRVMTDLITINPGNPVTLEVSPPNMTLAVQEGTRFTAVARDEFGNAVPSTATWAVVGEGGSIDGDGLFTASTVAGTFNNKIEASVQTEAGELEAAGSVTVEPGPISQVVVRPSQAILEIGDTQVFAVEVLDEFKNPITDALISFKSTADVGTIDGDGSFIAGTQAGVFPDAVQVEAVKDTARASATSDVSIEPGPLASIKVVPSPALLRRGDSVDLTATGYDRHGNTIPELEFAWEADPGLAVDRTGRVTTGPVIGGPGLVGWWPGEGNADDVAGGNDGVLRGGASFAPGVVGQGFNLDGMNDYILVADDDNLDITGEVTVHFWAKRNGFSIGRPEWILIKGGAGVGGVDVPSVFGFAFARPGGGPADSLRVFFERADGTDVNIIGPQISDAFFHHYAYVRSGINHKVYIDGALFPHQLFLEHTLIPDDTFAGFPGSSEGLPFVIGAIRTDNDPSGFRWHFNGIIDEVQVFNRGLSEAEIKNIYDATKPNAQLGVTVRASYKSSQRSALVAVAVGN